MASEGLVLVVGWPVQKMQRDGSVRSTSLSGGETVVGDHLRLLRGDLFGACMALVCSRAV